MTNHHPEAVMPTRPIDTAGMSPAQRRMTIQGMLGRRVRLVLGDSHAQRTEVDVELFAVAGEVETDTPDRITHLIGRVYSEDYRHVVIPLWRILSVTPLGWALSDPRHPDYQAPTMTVKPAGRRQPR